MVLLAAMFGLPYFEAVASASKEVAPGFHDHSRHHKKTSAGGTFHTH
jgi:hypothetical protein